MKLTDNTSTKLSASFNLDEFIVSQVAERHGYRNEPNEKQTENMRLLCVNVLQPLREIINVPIFINSGFRSFDVNAAVGGKFNSQHREGKAADFIVPSMNLADVFNIVLQKLSFDQLIYEFGKWIHVSWNRELNRKDVMISKTVYGKTVYENVKSETLYPAINAGQAVRII
ncbi:MAG: peptidase M15A [Stygiobacter sp.]|nr:MAG: peptidase M15A [Stygiobacter sp.]